MRKMSLVVLLGCLAAPLMADVPPLGGFYYGQMAAPTGWEWQSPDSLSYNKQQPHAWFFAFKDTEEARRVLPENSSYWQSLDGEWQFHWVNHPDKRPKDFFLPSYDASGWDKVSVPMNWNVVGIQPDGTRRYGSPIYSNQRVIFQHSVKVDDWKGGVMRTPPTDWLTYNDRNEVGSYRRTFTIPADWDGRKIYVNFDGVDSFFYLYVNGRYVGFSKNSRNLAEFDITPYLVKGDNLLAVEVYRNSDGSFLESQDMMRLPGIFRTVALTAKPTVQVRDVVAIPDYDATYTQASLNITAQVSNLSGKKQSGYSLSYTLYENKLYSDDNTLVPGVTATVSVDNLAKDGNGEASVRLEAGSAVKPWSAEAPHRYVLVGQLKDKKGKVVETFSTTVGFRKIEIKETAAKDDEFGLAGRYYYLNGKPIKMKGVNRHETNAALGHALTREHMEQEVIMMKRANINHVRDSHYPDAPYWYYLCDKYGIYLEDEANIESHEYYYGKESLSHVKEFRNAHIARNMEMVHANINHPSVCLWSLGNEAGPGDNFLESYKAIKAFDTSRPVQYERNNDIVDIGSNQYPSIDGTREAVRGTVQGMKYPFHISEYGHSMGNAVGNLVDYWDAIESTNFYIGGAIWEWVDHGLYNYTADGTRYIAYGGDFGDKPNDGTFCMDGVMRSDLTPKPQYYEIKKVYQNVGISAVDMTQGRIEIFNKNYFEPLNGYDIVWSLWQDGVCIQKDQRLQGAKNILGPRERQQYVLPYDYAALDAGSEYFVKVECRLANDMPWAEKGYTQMDEQLPVKTATEKTPIVTVANEGDKITYLTKDNYLVVSGSTFKAIFDTETGSLYDLRYGDRVIVTDGNGPRLDAYRAPTDNDAGAGYAGPWFNNGLYDLKHHALSHSITPKKDGTLQVNFIIESQGDSACTDGYSNRDRNPDDAYTFRKNRRKMQSDEFKFTTNVAYTLYRDGSIEVHSAIAANSSSVLLPRIGYSMVLPTDMDRYYYYGRGPVNNYNDRETSQYVELHASTPQEQGIFMCKPQAMGNREGVRWCALTDATGRGAVFVADSVMSASALPWSEQELTVAAHPYQLPASTGTHLHLDAKVTGLGGASCGQGGPLRDDRTMSTARDFGFVIRPLTLGRAALSHINATARVSLSGEMPINISRNRAGIVTLSSGAKDRTIVYTAGNNKKATTYHGEAIQLRQGGTVTAWYKENPAMKVSMTYDRVESVPLEVIGASSEEPNGGAAAHFVDGDPNTLWHSIYSITLAKYPHFVDFDASETKTMRGFCYQPRVGGGNGNIKDYEVYVSQDGQNWGEPVAKGSFANDDSVKKVMFSHAVKARYIRFKALSEQNGQEFASGAEFSLIAD